MLHTGTSGIVHVASNVSFDPDPNKVIPSVLSGLDNTLEAATTEPKMKRFVYTSSSFAATYPNPDKKIDIDVDTWNNECIKNAWAPGPYPPERAWDVYGASKTQAEQELWKFAKERKPHFETNAVLPNANFGPVLAPGDDGASTAAWATTLFLKGEEGLKGLQDIPPRGLDHPSIIAEC